MVALSSLGGAGWQFFDDNGVILSGGMLYSYLAGTTGPATTYTSSAGTIPNTNPIVLDAAGRPPNEIWLDPNISYKFVLKTATGVSIWTKDDIYAIQSSGPLNTFIANLASASAGKGAALVGYSQGSANAVARTVNDRLRDYVSVKDFGAVGDGVTDDTIAIQAAVDYAISSDTHSVFFPFAQRERYRLTSTIVISASGFQLLGNVAPIYEPETGGYIFGDRGVTDLFNYGNGAAITPSNQFVVEGLAFYSDTGLTQNAIKHSVNNNGPHRGTLLRKCAAKGFANVFIADVPTANFITTASVVVDNCVFRGNTNAVNSVERSFGLRFVGNQSEAGARITGSWDAGVTITDNMLEGQSNPINIDSPAASVVIENNYFEANSGDYIVRFKGSALNAILDMRFNYLARVISVDVYRVEGIVKVIEKNIVSTINYLPAVGSTPEQKARKALITGLGAFFLPTSDLSGRLYTGVELSEFAAGYTNPLRVAGVLPSTAVVSKNLGTVSMQTPFGATTTGVTITGFPATYYPTPSSTPALLTKSWSAGDVLVACALVRVEDETQPYFSIYNQAYADTDVKCSQINIYPVNDGEWYLMFAVRSTSVAGTGCRFRFGSNGVLTSTKNIHVAAVGIDVIPAADFETYGTGSTTAVRAFARLFNPFVI